MTWKLYFIQQFAPVFCDFFVFGFELPLPMIFYNLTECILFSVGNQDEESAANEEDSTNYTRSHLTDHAYSKDPVFDKQVKYF